MSSILYLLVKRDKSSFKIGITDNFQARHDRLRTFWGEFDLASSRMVLGTKKDISGLEKTLHYLLEKWRTEPTIKADGHTEWFSMSCFDEALGLIQLAATNRGFQSENLITKSIDLPQKSPKQKRQIDNSKYFSDLAELKRNWPYYEKATLDFKDNPNHNGSFLWTIDIALCPKSPYELLGFAINTHFIAVATSRYYLECEPQIVTISLSKRSLSDLREYACFKEAYDFTSEMIQKLELHRSHMGRVNDGLPLSALQAPTGVAS